MNYQRVVIVGNLGGDPELRYLPNGRGVCNFSLATNRSYTNSSGERISKPTWFRVSSWGKQAETCNQYLRKGSHVLVEGRLKDGEPRAWIDKKTGEPRASYELDADKVVFMDTKGTGQQAIEEFADEFDGYVEEDREIPF